MACSVTTINVSLMFQVTVNRTVFSENMKFRGSVSGILQLHFLCNVTNKCNSDNLISFFIFLCLLLRNRHLVQFQCKP
jgi:hypothetical protein